MQNANPLQDWSVGQNRLYFIATRKSTSIVNVIFVAARKNTPATDGYKQMNVPSPVYLFEIGR